MINTVNAPEAMKNDLLALLDKGFEENKAKLCFKLEHNDRREEYDTIVTYQNDVLSQFDDAKCVCGISYENLGDVEGKMFVAVNKSILEKWNVTPEEICDECMKNLEDEEIELKTVWGAMVELAPEMKFMEEPEDVEGMYVLSNGTRINGARILMSDYVMKTLKEKFKKFYIIPSSIHELLIVPDRDDISIEHLEEIVRSVNDTQVEERDRLSYKVAYIA